MSTWAEGDDVPNSLHLQSISGFGSREVLSQALGEGDGQFEWGLFAGEGVLYPFRHGCCM